jgi:hypothetical protein
VFVFSQIRATDKFPTETEHIAIVRKPLCRGLGLVPAESAKIVLLSGPEISSL